jgi:hypothetical protein
LGTSAVVLFARPGILTEEQRAQVMARRLGIVERTVTRALAEGDRLCGLELADGRRARGPPIRAPTLRPE